VQARQSGKKCMKISGLKGHSHKNDFEILTVNDRLGPKNLGPPSLFKFVTLILTAS
jgi:hypothetical protein